jgi:epoxyqueuosine reductase
MTADLRDEIRQKAFDEGFDTVGFTTADSNPRDRAALENFLHEGRHGHMDWMSKVQWSDDNPRGNPKALMAEARTVIVFGANYGPASDPLDILSHTDQGAISVYAQATKDYHDVLKKRLKRIGRWLVERHADSALKVFVDTAPVMEKPLAQRAGLGWQGKHSNLVSKAFGSWLFLGEIFTSLEIPPDLPEPDHCGSCTQCLSVCPTAAFPEPYQLDARRCISYLTIEHQGVIAPELMAAMGNHIYGCDDCLAVCPWNKFAAPSAEPAFQPRAELSAPGLAELAALDEAAFRQMFAGSPIKRTGRERFLRNVLIAIGNSAEPRLLEVTEKLSNDASPLIAETARWALAQLSALDAKGDKDTFLEERQSP